MLLDSYSAQLDYRQMEYDYRAQMYLVVVSDRCPACSLEISLTVEIPSCDVDLLLNDGQLTITQRVLQILRFKVHPDDLFEGTCRCGRKVVLLGALFFT